MIANVRIACETRLRVIANYFHRGRIEVPALPFHAITHRNGIPKMAISRGPVFELPNVVNRRGEINQVVGGDFVGKWQTCRNPTNIIYCVFMDTHNFRNFFLRVAGQPKVLLKQPLPHGFSCTVGMASLT